MFRIARKRSAGSRQAENFDLLISKTAGGCTVIVRDPQHGEAHADFVRPFSKEDLDNILQAGGACRDVNRPAPEVRLLAQDVGRSLFEAVFSPKILTLWRLRRRDAELAGKNLRLRLHLDDSSDLWDWPWELLYDEAVPGFLASLPATPVVRYIEMLELIRPLRVRPPIRVLAVSACPAGFSPLSIQEELADLESSLADLREAERVELDRLDHATWQALGRKLQENTVHILHFIGHGTFDASRGGGLLLLQREDGEAEPVGAQELNVLLQAHPQIRLVVLNVCQGARGGGSDPFAGLTQSLVRGRVPAVVAMRSSVTDRAAIEFSRAFYRSLSRREPVDLAVYRGRHAMFRQDSTEWASPVLAMRSPDGKIFDFSRWEILVDGTQRIASTWRHWLVALLLLVLLSVALRPLVKRSLDPNLYQAWLNPAECPSPPGLAIAFVEIQPDPPLRPYCIGRYEVTQRIWKDVVGDLRTRRRGNALPEVRVSWDDAMGFLAALNQRDSRGGFRLPTDPEWVYAAMAGSKEPPVASAQTANCDNKEEDDGYEGTAPVGSFLPNDLGLYDMLGNVSEWVSDGSPAGAKKVHRGGSFRNVPRNCSVDFRSPIKPDAHDDTGFRLVREPVKKAGT